MSFLTEITLRRMATVQLPRTMAATAPRAAFSTSVRQRKTATESVKDGLKTVDRAVSDKIVGGIDMSSNVAHKIKEAGDDVVHGKAKKFKNEAEGKASEMAGEAKGKAHEAAGKAKGAAEEAKQKL